MNKIPFVVVGGGSGIGQALAWLLAKQSEYVVVIGRRKDALEKTCSKFPHYITSISADVAKETGREKIVKSLEGVKQIKALILGAAIIKPLSSITTISLEQWRETQAVNVEGPLFLTQKLLPKLNNARVLLFSSVLSRKPHPSLAAYCVSKAAILMLYECFKSDFQSMDIHFGCVNPGLVETRLFFQVADNRDIFPKEYQQMYQKLIDEKWFLKPRTVAYFIYWLLCSIDVEKFSSQEWNIFDSSHHKYWAKELSLSEINLGILTTASML